MAAAAGVSREQIIRLEAGSSMPMWRTVIALADALGAEPMELFPAPESLNLRERRL